MTKEKIPQVSFEFFPPTTPAMEETLWNSIQRLAPLQPRFVSVTYGADGSTREVDYTPGVARAVSAPVEHNAINVGDVDIVVMEIEYKK